MPPSLLMEDHQEAYFFWKDLDLRGATCVHVDAHLDVSNFKVPGYGLLEAPELNCANFLHRAIREGLVSHLVWVIPPHLPGSLSLLEWIKDELHNWMHLALADFASLRLTDGRIEGSLTGARFTVCTSDRLPALPQQPLLIDVDVDYYLGPHDEVWQTPLELQAALSHLDAQAITVANSVVGGYTPLELRYLGDLTLLALQDPEPARRLWAQLQRGEPTGLPAWARAALAARAAVSAGEDHFGPGWERAVALDGNYQANVFDAAAFYFMRHQHERSRFWLQKATGDLVSPALYLEALMAMREQKPEEALGYFQGLLEGGALALEPRNRGHLLEMAGRCLARCQRPAEAAEQFRAALKLDPADAPVWRELARAQRAAGDSPGAARSFRKALALAPQELACAQARLELAEVYTESGQAVMAQAELRLLETPEVPAEYRLEAQRLALRLKLA